MLAYQVRYVGTDRANPVPGATACHYRDFSIGALPDAVEFSYAHCGALIVLYDKNSRDEIVWAQNLLATLPHATWKTNPTKKVGDQNLLPPTDLNADVNASYAAAFAVDAAYNN